MLGQLSDLTGAVPGEKFTVTCDCTGAGWGEAKFDVVLHGRSLPHTVRETSKGVYSIAFTPQERGKHRIYVYYNGIESRGVPFLFAFSSSSLSYARFSLRVRIPGSPFSVRVGKDDKRRQRKSESTSNSTLNRSKDYSHDLSSERNRHSSCFLCDRFALICRFELP